MKKDLEAHSKTAAPKAAAIVKKETEGLDYDRTRRTKAPCQILSYHCIAFLVAGVILFVGNASSQGTF